MMEWLHMLGLEQYYNTLSQQGYDDLDKVTDITWEDLEEIGIQKLGQSTRSLLYCVAAFVLSLLSSFLVCELISY